MDVRKIFQILGIEETKDEEQIKQAYRNKLVTVNPEGFIRLRTAYEDALLYSKEQEEVVISEGPVKCLQRMCVERI